MDRNQIEITNAHRQYLETRSAKDRLVQEVKEDELNKLVNHIRNTNISSSVVFIISIVVLVLVFGLNTTSAQAQDMSIDPIDDARMGSPVVLKLANGLSAVEEGNYENALYYFNQAISIAPETAHGYTGRAFVNMHYGNYDLALADALFALELDPSHSAAHYLLGEIYFAMEDYTDAQFHFEAYQTDVELAEKEPIMIVVLVGANSMMILDQRLDTCLEFLP